MTSILKKHTARLDGGNPVKVVCFTFIIHFILFTGIAAANIKMIPGDFSELAEKAGASVVNISTVKKVKGGGNILRQYPRSRFGNNNDPMNDFLERFFGNERLREFKQRSLGSGFIIDREGYIVTNNHVVENADKIKVILKDGKEYDAEIIGRDENTDLALIKIKPDHGLPVLNLGNSEKLKVGEWVVAIGNPFGYGHTVTAGIVSAKGRTIGASVYDDFIQTDTSINPGNSGGPLIDLNGNVIGINTAIVPGGQGIGFAVPSNLAKGIIEQLKSKGNVTRGWLGVNIQNVNPDIAKYYELKDEKGVFVMDVVPGDPADEGGIKPKDVIVEFNGEKIEDARDLTNTVADTEVGSKVNVKVRRNGRLKSLNVTIAQKGDGSEAESLDNKDTDSEIGIGLAELSEELVKRRNLRSSEGVMVTSVAPDSKADKAGLKPGDIIEEINHRKITSKQDYFKAVENIKKGKIMNLAVIRMNGRFQVFSIEK